MVKKYSFAAGFVLLILGILNFFAPGFQAPAPHAVLHMLAGVLGMGVAIRSEGTDFVKWLGVCSVIMAGLGFAGVNEVLNILGFDIFLKWIYLILGLLSIWVYLTVKQESFGPPKKESV